MWTNGVNTEPELKEFGLLGSLRWWSAALLRGLGYRIDHGDSSSCQASGTEPPACPLCSAFGCTNWRRRFRFEVDGNLSVAAPARVWISGHPLGDDHKGWSLPSGYGTGPALRLSERGIGGNWRALLALALKVAERGGAIGGKTALGQGVFGIENGHLAALAGVQPECALTSLGEGTAGPSSDLPDLRCFLFSEYEVVGDLEAAHGRLHTDTGVNLPLNGVAFRCSWASVLVRYKLREWVRSQPGIDDVIRHWLLGAVKLTPGGWEPVGSKVFVSHLYRAATARTNEPWRLRIWAWLPTWSKAIPPRGKGRPAPGEVLELTSQVGEVRSLLNDACHMQTLIADALAVQPNHVSRLWHWSGPNGDPINDLVGVEW